MATAFKAGPPEGHRVARLLAMAPEWSLDSGHAHPDANSFIIWAGGRYLTGDTGYAGVPQARHHNTITVDGAGQGVEGDHDVWRGMDYARLAGTRIISVSSERGLRDRGRGGRSVSAGSRRRSASAHLRVRRSEDVQRDR